MKKGTKNITNPDELDKNLQYSSPVTWITLSLVTLLLVAFFTWASLYRIKVELTAVADVVGGNVTLHIDEAKRPKLKEGQKVYISGQEGEILSFLNTEPVLSTFSLDDGKYDCSIVIQEMKPIDFLFK